MVDRRGFFRRLLAETSALADELGGQRQLRLEEIGLLPDETLRGMIPVLMHTGSYLIQGRYILARHSADPKQIVFEFADQEKAILDLIDGHRSVDEIAKNLALTREVDHDTAFARVKGLFSTLAKYSLCQPKNRHE